MEITSTSTEGFKNNGSRRYGMHFSIANIIQVPLFVLLEYTRILRGKPHYHEIEGTGGGSVREREDDGGGLKVLFRNNFSPKV